PQVLCAVEGELARLVAGEYGTGICIESRLDRDPPVCLDRAAPESGRNRGTAQDGVADQPVKFDRLISAVDHPTDQEAGAAGRLGCPRRIGGRETSTDRGAIRGEGELPVDRDIDVEVGLLADELEENVI